jgi:hypothetical protein
MWMIEHKTATPSPRELNGHQMAVRLLGQTPIVIGTAQESSLRVLCFPSVETFPGVFPPTKFRPISMVAGRRRRGQIKQGKTPQLFLFGFTTKI